MERYIACKQTEKRKATSKGKEKKQGLELQAFHKQLIVLSSPKYLQIHIAEFAWPSLC